MAAKSTREVDISSKIPQNVNYVAGWVAIRVANPSLYEATLSTFGTLTKLNIVNNSTVSEDINIVVYILYT